MMKIGLVGAHRVGKTTLAKQVAEQAGLTFVNTSTSDVFKARKIDAKQSLPLHERLDCQLDILKLLGERYEAAGASFVADRTPLDAAAYMMLELNREGALEMESDSVLDDLVDAYFRTCIHLTNKHFSSVFLIQPGIPIVHDATKATAPASRAYMEALNYTMKGLMRDDRLNISRYYLGRDILEMSDRVSHVLTAIDADTMAHFDDKQLYPMAIN